MREAARSSAGASVAACDLLRARADVWSLELAEPDANLLTSIKAVSCVVVAGTGAIVAVAAQMAARNDCDGGDQVLLVTDRPGRRQLAGIAAAVTGSRKTPRGAAPEASRSEVSYPLHGGV